MRAIALYTLIAAVVAPSELPAKKHDGAFPQWMAGNWCNRDGDRRGDEVWLEEAGGVMIGLGRTVQPGSKTQFEFMRIEDQNGVLTFVAQPQGNPPTAFKRADSGEHWIRFENAAHDFPNVVTYRREGGSLHAEISGPGEDGKIFSIPFDFVRCAD